MANIIVADPDSCWRSVMAPDTATYSCAVAKLKGSASAVDNVAFQVVIQRDGGIIFLPTSITGKNQIPPSPLLALFVIPQTIMFARTMTPKVVPMRPVKR
jgi:hypothetical protein